MITKGCSGLSTGGTGCILSLDLLVLEITLLGQALRKGAGRGNSILTAFQAATRPCHALATLRGLGEQAGGAWRGPWPHVAASRQRLYLEFVPFYPHLSPKLLV